MMHRSAQTSLAAPLTATLLFAASCGGGGGGGGGSSDFAIQEASNGFGRLLPYETFVPDAQGNDSDQLIAIRSLDDLLNNVTPGSPILEVTNWPTSAILPNSLAGNHFVYVEFTRPLEVDSILDPTTTGLVNSGLTGSITISAVDPLTGDSAPVVGRAFVGGQTYAQGAGGLELQQWVTLQGSKPVAEDVDGAMPGLGFPGTENTTGFNGSAKLVSDQTFVFIPDADGDLETHETFPVGRQIRVRISDGNQGVGGVTSQGGEFLAEPGLASATVGTDTIAPEVALSPPPFNFPTISPGNGDQDVDPEANIVVEFSEPIQPLSISSFPTAGPPTLASAIQIQFGPSSAEVDVPYNVMPVSPFDLSRIELIPAFQFPGSGPDQLECGNFSEIRVTVASGQFEDLVGMMNTLGTSTSFTTGQGAAIVNAPVLPDVIYVGRNLSATPSISVIDLNGFGAGTGNPAWDPNFPIQEGNSNYPNNPNVRLQGSQLTPPLPSQGSCTIDGGSAGVFTLTRDSSLDTRLVRSPLIQSIGDIMIGHALDSTFNNSTTICQSGGNLCADTGIKAVVPVFTGNNTLGPQGAGQFGTIGVSGGENIVSWAPHPNPPRLKFPPLCLQPAILGEEPTSVGTMASNLLTPGGNVFGIPASDIAPQNILAREQNGFFLGPSTPQAAIGSCLAYSTRQQLGHFLYVLDRVQAEIVVLNSNRFTVIDRIPLPDPTSMAMGPNLDLLAVTNQSADIVSFIDINPTSGTFHQVVRTTQVGAGPLGIAWDPGNEDILVCNQAEGTVSIISAFSFQVRKVLNNLLNAPFEVAVTQRGGLTTAFARLIYYGWILNQDGSVAIYESGPTTPLSSTALNAEGEGFNDIVGNLPFTFQNPKTIQPDHINLGGAVWIVHETKLDFNGDPLLEGGAVSNVRLVTQGAGPDVGQTLAPNPPANVFAIDVSIGSDQLTGIPVDLAFDNLMNLGGLINSTNVFSAGSPIPFNGKAQQKGSGANVLVGVGQNANEPTYMFLAVPNSTQGGGAIDVINLTSGFTRFDTNPFDAGVQSIPAPGATVVADYWRQ